MLESGALDPLGIVTGRGTNEKQNWLFTVGSLIYVFMVFVDERDTLEFVGTKKTRKQTQGLFVEVVRR